MYEVVTTYVPTPDPIPKRPLPPQGWKLVGLKLVTPGRALVGRHYEEHVGKVRAGATGGCDCCCPVGI